MIRKNQISPLAAKYRSKGIIAIVISLILAGIILLIAMYANNGNFLWLLIFVAIPVAFAYAFNAEYNSRVKNETIIKLFSEDFENVTYKIKEGFSKEEIEYTDLFKIGTSYTTNDDLRGVFNGVEFRRADVVSSTTYSTGKTTHTVYHFHGQIYQFPFNKETFGRHKITSTWAGLGRNRSNLNMQKIALDHREFEKVFQAYTNNPQELYYILTPHLMDKILEIEEKYKATLLVSIVDRIIYLGFFSNKDRLEPNVFKDLDNSYFTDIRSEIARIKNLITVLNLEDDYFMSNTKGEE